MPKKIDATLKQRAVGWCLSTRTSTRQEAECIRTTVFHRRPYRTIAGVEHATASWVGWYNIERLHGTLGMVTPVEFEQHHYATLNREPRPE